MGYHSPIKIIWIDPTIEWKALHQTFEWSSENSEVTQTPFTQNSE
jgi:hypothetical protein